MYLSFSSKYNLHPNSRKWLFNMEKQGYIKCIERNPPFKYKLSPKAREFINLINSWKAELDKLIKAKGISDLDKLLQSLKIKN